MLRTAQEAADYNRGLPAPMRWAHVVLAHGPAPVWRWMHEPSRRGWMPALALGVVIGLMVFPFDGAIARMVARTGIGDDRELKAWVQYGAIGSIVFTSVVILLLDRAKAMRIWDLAAANVLNALVCTVLKMLIGRPRPKYEDPAFVAGPWGMYPIDGPRLPDGTPGEPVLEHGWSTLRPDLWSMPSSHAASAAILSVFLAALYPPLRWPGVVLVGVVALGRVAVGSGVERDAGGTVVGYTYGAHWPSDVIVGAAIGLAVGRVVIENAWGVRMAREVAAWFTDDGGGRRGQTRRAGAPS